MSANTINVIRKILEANITGTINKNQLDAIVDVYENKKTWQPDNILVLTLNAYFPAPYYMIDAIKVSNLITKQ